MERPNAVIFPIKINADRKLAYNCRSDGRNRGTETISVHEDIKNKSDSSYPDSTKNPPIERINRWTQTHDDRGQFVNEIELDNLKLVEIPIIFYKLIIRQLDKSLWLQGLGGVYVLLLSVFIPAVLTNWPQHNVFLHPGYWYEPLVPWIICYALGSAVSSIIDCSLVMGVDIVLSFSAYSKVVLANSLGFALTYILIYVIWTYIGYIYPMPFTGHICVIATYPWKMAAFWFLFPSCMRVDDKVFRKKLFSYMYLFPITLITGFAYSQIPPLFLVVPEKFQWCLGILLPCIKQFVLWMYRKSAYKAAGRKTLSATIMVITLGCSIHSFSVVLLLGSKVTNTTAYVVIFLDSIPNLWACLQIVKKHRSGISPLMESEKIQDELKCLVLEELLEVLVPAVYCSSFLIAYYGPNMEILGNVGSDMWQYERVEDVSVELKTTALLFMIDAILAFVTGVILWLFCKLNVIKTYCYIVYHYGLYISTTTAGSLCAVR